MSEHSFENAPDMGQEFSDVSDTSYEMPLEHDAQHWEPMEGHEQPSEKHLEMHLTPGGSLEQAVHTELDEAARARIIEAQREEQARHELPDEKELDFAGDFEEARRNAWGWDPESEQEYEQWSIEQSNELHNDPFETGRRFDRENERERGDWER